MIKTIQKKITVSAIIMIVLGVLVCIPSCTMVLIITVMPDSIGAYYIEDMLSVVAGSPFYPLVCGVCYLVFGLIAFNSGRKPGKGKYVKIIGIAFLAVYIVMFFTFVFIVTMPAHLGIVTIGLVIAIIFGILFVSGGDKRLKNGN